jgi:hypothetical protein
VLRDLFSFLRALWTEWKVLLTGGTIIAALAIFTAVSTKPIPLATNWLILGLTFICASFLAWRKAWISSGSDLVDIDPEWLSDQFSNRTRIQANVLIKPYLGKRIRVTGELRDILLLLFTGIVYLEKSPKELFSKGVKLRMSRWRAAELSSLPKGTRMTVVGRISEVDYSGLDLSGVQFIGIEPTLEVAKNPH